MTKLSVCSAIEWINLLILMVSLSLHLILIFDIFAC